MSESFHFRCWKQQVEDPLWAGYAPHTVAIPSLESDQEDDQIASWLRFPSDSNDNDTIMVRPDLNKEQTLMASNNNESATVPHTTEGIMNMSTSLAKRNDAVNVSEGKVGTSHATGVKKKGRENKGRCQVGGLRSGEKRKDILEPPCILPKRLRAPDVHRLNERRRRDKINEKIKALQELMPRCSKLDKVSTLDKAIGYMKDLQMQIRMLSPGYDMGTQMIYGMSRPFMQSMSMCTDMSIPALQPIHANMNTRMCLSPGMIPIGPPLQYPPPMHMLPQHDMASSMFLFPQAGDPRIFPSYMQGNF